MQRLGIIVGMQSEIRLAKALYPYAIEVSGATLEGATRAMQRLMQQNIDAIISFGFAAALDPLLKPGSIILPHTIYMEEKDFIPNAQLRAKLGSEKPNIRIGALLHSNIVIETAKKKKELFEKTGCIALDMESGIMAQYCEKNDIAFAVLRVICDPAVRDLPPLACIAISQNGSLNSKYIFKSLLSRPSQVVDLVKLGIDAATAYWNLNHYVYKYLTSLNYSS